MSLVRSRLFHRFAITRGDLALAALVAVPVVGSTVEQAARTHRPLALLLILGAVVAVFLRRERTGAALVIAVALDAVMPENRALLLPVLVVLYTVATRTPWKTAAQAAAGAAAVMTLAGAAFGSGLIEGHGGLLGYAIGTSASCAAAVAVGLYVAARRRVIDGLREHAERLDRERELLADRAVAQERVRIAQELHDIVAHNVSLIVVEAQALGATVPDDRVTKSTEAIADLGRQAMSEMHTTLRLLRADGSETPELVPQPGLAQLERLLERSRAAGLEIEFIVDGQPRPLSRSVDLSAFRIIQEALTNVVKHAAGASTKVTLAYQPQGLELTIIDHGDQARTTLLQEPADGHGVIGMRERAALFGGTLTTEVLTPGGFQVTAVLPYQPSS
jgi:signal transduction histidine kinase